MKILYNFGVFSIGGITVINPEVLPVTAYVNSVLNLGSLVLNETQNVINDGDSFDLPDNIIAEKGDYPLNNCKACNSQGVAHCAHPEECGQIKIAPCYRLKLKEPLEDTGSKETQDRRITIAANVIMFLSEYIHGLNTGRKKESVDLALLNAQDQFDSLT